MPAPASISIMPSIVTWDTDAKVRCCFDEFSPWAAWADRGSLKERTWNHTIACYPGVYLLARFERRAPSGPADYLNTATVYVGEARILGGPMEALR